MTTNPPLDFRAWAELSASLQGQDELERARLLTRAQLSEARFAVIDAHWRSTLAEEERAGHTARAIWYRNLCAATARKLRGPPPASPLTKTVDVQAAMREISTTHGLPFRVPARNEPPARPSDSAQLNAPPAAKTTPGVASALTRSAPAPARSAPAPKMGLHGTVDLEAAMAEAGLSRDPLPFSMRGPHTAQRAPTPVSAPAPHSSAPAVVPAGPTWQDAASPADSIEAYAAFVAATLDAPTNVERTAAARKLATSSEVHRLHAEWTRRMRKDPELSRRYREELRSRRA